MICLDRESVRIRMGIRDATSFQHTHFRLIHQKNLKYVDRKTRHGFGWLRESAEFSWVFCDRCLGRHCGSHRLPWNGWSEGACGNDIVNEQIASTGNDLVLKSMQWAHLIAKSLDAQQLHQRAELVPAGHHGED